MNALCYKTVFSKRLGALVAVGEHATSQSKGQGAGASSGAAAWDLGSVLRFVGVLTWGFAAVSMAWSQTLPQGGRVSQGQVTISQSGQQMAINQSTTKAVVNWDSFDIGANAKVNIAQPSSQSVLLNRVLSDNPTQILGQLQANGQVVLVNPKGIVVGSDGSVSASAFTASTLNISDADFMAGNGRYTREGSTGEVVNKGRIHVAPGGYVALLGARVSNEGQIIAPQGSVALGAAETVTVPIGRTGKIKLELTPASINASVANQKGGVIVAEGGQVYMQAAALGQAVASALHSGHIDTSGAQAGAVHVLADGGQIKVDGSITANSSGQDDQGQLRKGGDIFIGRDEETGVLARTTDASGAQLESQRGFVETSGDHLSTTGTRVKAAEWLLDPYNITIASSAASGTAYGSNYTSAADSVILASDISANLTAGTSVTIATGTGGDSAGGNINVNANIAKSGGADATLTLKAHNDIVVATGTTITSTVGRLNVVLNSDLDASGAGAIVMNTGSGITSNGGNITLGGGSAGNGTGHASGNGTFGHGIALNGATLTSGAGNIKLTAQSHTAGNTIYGINLAGASTITTTSGHVDISGTGRTTGQYGYGMLITGGAKVITDTGNVTINAISSDVGSSDAVGIQIRTDGGVTTNSGNIAITGSSRGPAGQYNQGITFNNGGSLVAGSSGTVTLTGTGGSAGNLSAGVAGTRVTTSGAAVVINGSTLAAAVGSVDIETGSATISTSGGNVTLVANSYLGGGSEVVNAGSGTVTLQNRTAGISIDVGGTSADVLGATPKLGISAAELGKIIAGSVVVGRNDATASGNVTVNAITLGNTSGNLTVLGNDITVNDNLTKTAGTDATLSLRARDNIHVAANKTITSTSGKLNVVLNSYSDGSGDNAGAIVMNSGSGITSNGGNIRLSGGTVDVSPWSWAYGTATSPHGISLTGTELSAGGGNISLRGASMTGNYLGHGVHIDGGTITTTGGGFIDIQGHSTGTSQFSSGVAVLGASITGGSTNNTRLIGTNASAGTQGRYQGVWLNNNLAGVSALVTSTGGSVTVTGTGGGGGASGVNYGVVIENGLLSSGGTGTVNVTGTGGNTTGPNNSGVSINGTAASPIGISSSGGTINVTGTGGAGGLGQGIWFVSGRNGNIQSGNNAAINLTTDSLVMESGAINAGTGTVTVQNRTAGTLVDVGGADVLTGSPLTLGVSNAELARLSAGSVVIGSTAQQTGNLTVSSAITTPNASQLTLVSNNTIAVNAAITNTSANHQTLNLNAENGIVQRANITATGAGQLNVVMNAKGLTNGVAVASMTAEQRALSHGIFVDAATINANGGDVTLNGTSYAASALQTNGVGKGVQIHNLTNITARHIEITGVAENQSGNTSHGVVFQRYRDTANLNATGDITITGTLQGAGNGSGVFTNESGWGAQAPMVSAGGKFTLRGNNRGASSNTGAAIQMRSGMQVRAVGDVVVQAETNNAAARAMDFYSRATSVWTDGAGALEGNASFRSIDASGVASGNVLIQSNQGSIHFNNLTDPTLTKGALTTLTAITGRNVVIDNTGASMTTGANNTVGTGSIDAVTGVITRGTGTSASSNSGIQLTDGRSITASNNINMFGASTTGSGVAISGASALSATTPGGTGDININGVNTSSSGAAINISHASSTINANNVVKLTSGGTGSGTSLVASGNITVGGELQVENPAVGSISGVVSGTGMLRKVGAGTLVLTGANTYTGGTTANGGVLQVGNGGTTGTLGVGGGVSIGATLAVNRSDAFAINQDISGAGNLQQIGSGSTVLSGTNTYAGTTTITTGSLQVGAGGTTGTLGVGAVSVSSGAALNFNRSDALTVANAISGAGTVSQNGSGAGTSSNLSLTGYLEAATGAFNANHGTLTFNAAAANRRFNGSAININNGSTVRILSGANLNYSFGTTWNFDSQGGGTIDASPQVNFVMGFGTTSPHNTFNSNGGATNTIRGPHTGGINTNVATNVTTFNVAPGSSSVGLNVVADLWNSGTVTKTGAGLMLLSGQKTGVYTGAVNVTQGTLQVGDGGANGTLGTGAVNVSSGADLVINRSDTVTVGNLISGAGNLTQAGTGTTILTGANTYSGTTTINSGHLHIGNGGGTGALGTGNVSINHADSQLVFNRTGAVTAANAINGVGRIVQRGTGSVKLSGDNSALSGGITLSRGSLMLGNGAGDTNKTAGTGTITMGDANTGANNITLEIESSHGSLGSNQIRLNRNIHVTQHGTGTATISGVKGAGSGAFTEIISSITLDRNVVLHDGTADRFGVSGALSGPGNITMTGTRISRSGSNISDDFTGSVTVNSGTTLQANTDQIFSTKTDLQVNGTLNLMGGASQSIDSLTGSGSINSWNAFTSNPATLSVGNDNGSGTFSGTINTPAVANPVVVSLEKNGTGTQILTGNNTYSGSTTINAGTLQVGSGGNTGNLGTGAVVDNAHLVINRSNSYTIANALSGTGRVSQIGSGTTVLGANNSYAGTTTISGGTLQVGNGGSTGTLGVGDVTLSNNATLSYVRSADTTIANAITGAGNVSATITGAGSDLAVDRSISITGGTINLAADGNLSVTQAMGTNNTTANALVLNAGAATSAGTASGGDITFSGSGGVSVGTTGRATLYTGSMAGSTGLGVNTGFNRYNSDEQTSSFDTAALGSGTYAIYREAPSLSVRFNNASKTYDGQSFTGGNGLTVLSGFVNGDNDAQLGSISYSGSSQNAVNAGGYVISGTALSGLGYALSYTNGTLTVGKKDVTLESITASGKTYDGTNTAAISAVTLRSADFVNSETVTASAVGTFDSKDAGTRTATVTVAGTTLANGSNGGLASNYNVVGTDKTATATIAKKDVNLDGITASGKTYDGTNTAAISAVALRSTDFVGSETITATAVGTFDSKDAGSRTATVTAANTTLADGSNGGLATNYNVVGTDKTATATIAKKDVNLDGITASGKTYDGNNSAAISAVTLRSADFVGTETVTASAVGTFDSKDAGSRTATVTAANTTLADGSNGGLATNYNVVGTDKTATATIAKKDVNLDGITASGKTYDGTNTATISAVTLRSADFVGSETVTATAVGTFDSKDAGTRTATVTVAGTTLANGSNGGLASNYNVVGTDKTATATIAKKDVNLDGITASGKTYDGTNTAAISAVTLRSADFVNSETVTASAVGTFDSKDAGTRTATVTVAGTTLANGSNGGLASNYNVVGTDKTATATIAKKDVNLDGITASGKTYDGTNTAAISAVTLRSADFVNSETVTASAVGTFDSKDAGTRTATVTVAGTTLANGSNGGLASNYNVVGTDKTATATIAKKDVNLDGITASGKTYDGNNSAAISAVTLRSADFVGTETVTASAVGTFDSKDAGSRTATVTAANTTLADGSNGGLATNYNVVGTDKTATATIAKKDVNLDGITASGKTYDGTNTATISAVTLRSADFVGSETVTATAVGTFDSKDAGTRTATVTVAGTTLANGSNGGLASNYNVVGTDKTATATIAKKDVNLDGITASGKTYDGTNTAAISAVTLRSADFVNSETVTASAVGTFDSKDAGTRTATVTVAGTTLANGSNGGLASNYNVVGTDKTATATIAKKDVNLDGITASGKTYDGTNTATISAVTLRSADFVNSETVSASAVGTFDSKDAGTRTATVTVAGTTLANGSNGGLASNYNVVGTQTVTATINKANITVALQGSVEKTYDGLDSATVNSAHFASSGWVSGEGASITQTAAVYANKNVSANPGNGTVNANLQPSDYTAQANTDLNNYSLATNASGAVGKINPAALNIKVNDTKMFVTQDANLAFDQGFSYTGLVNGESATNALTGGAPGAGARSYTGAQFPGVGNLSGVYGLSTPTALNGNYTVSVTPGNLQVIQADQLLVTISSQSDAYGQRKAPQASVAASGTVTAQYCLVQSNCNGTNLYTLNLNSSNGSTWQGTDNTGNTITLGTGLAGSPTYSSGGFLNAGNHTYALASLSSTVANQFKGHEVNGGVLTITPLQVNLNASDVTKVYDGNDSLVSAKLTPSGTLSGDALQATFASGSFDGKNAGAQGFTLSGLALQGADQANYVLGSAQLSGTGSITPKDVNLDSITAAHKVYDGNRTATITSGAINTGVNGETLVISGSGMFSDANAADGKTVTVSNVTDLSMVDGSGSWSNYRLTTTGPITTTANITRKDVTLTGITAAHKVYDGSDTASITSASGAISTGVGTETLSVNGSGTFSDANAANGKTVTVTVANVSTLTKTNGTGNWNNYNLTTTGALTTTANITRKDVSLSSITALDKVYDGNNTATITSGAISTGVGSETLAISGSGTFSDANAANNKTVTVANVSTLAKANGTGNWSNYNLTTTGALTTTADITRKNVTLDSITAADKVYDGTAVASITGGSVSGTLTGESLSVSGQGSFNDKHVASNKTVTVQDVLTLSRDNGTGDWRNYQLITTGALTDQANITPKALSVSGITAAPKTYDGNTQATVATNAVVWNGRVAGDNLSLSSTGAFSDKNVGTDKVVTLTHSLSGTDLGNYTVTTQASTTANITPKALALSAGPVSKTYDGSLSYSTSADDLTALSAQLVSGDTVTAASLAFTDKNAGSGNKSITFNSATLEDGNNGGNYTLTLVGNNTSTINKAIITVALQGSAEKTYDGLDSATVNSAHFATSGWVSGEGASITQTAAVYANQNVSANPGNGTVNANLQLSDYAAQANTDLNNYSLASSASGAVGKINPAALNIKVNDTKMFVTQDANLAFDQGFSYTGLVNGESAANALTGGAPGAGERSYTGAQFPGVGSLSGVYGLSTVPTALNGNYSVSVTPGNLQVIPADQLLVTISSQSDAYGQRKAPQASVAASGTVTAQYCLVQSNCNGNNLYTLNLNSSNGSTWQGTDNTGNTITLGTGLAGSPTYSSGGFLNAGNHTYALASLSSTVANQFNGHEVNGGVLTITPLQMSLNASDVTKVYDGNNTLVSATLSPSGTLSGDALQATFASGSFDGKNAGAQGFTLSGLTLQGADQANYVLGSAQLSGTGTITPKAITVSGLQAQDKVYDGSTQASVQTSGAVFNGIVAGDQLSVTATGQFDTRHVGTHKTVSLSSSFGGADLDNYSITPQASSAASITPAPLVVTASAARKTYDGNTSAPGVGTVGALVGAAAGDTVAFAGSLAFTNKNAGTGKTVTVTGVRLVDGSNTDVSGNYAITYVNSQNGTIDRANASIAAQDNSTVYNGSTQSQTGLTYSGFVAGDDVQATGLASGRNAGSYLSSLSATGADAGNYNITYNNASLNISRRPASLSALGLTVVYNGLVQSLNGTQGSGFVAGDALSFGGLPSGRNVGQYSSAMTVSGADAANYDITLGNATLTITPKSASVTARPERVTYNGQTQQQSAAVLEGFIAGDDIRVSGLASGRNAGVYGSNVLASGQDAGNYSITYQQGALTIDKAPLQFVGTSAANKVYDGKTEARVTAGSITGLVGSETLSIDTVQGQFDSAEMGTAKPVQVVYGLSDGANGGLVANYQWSPVTVKASITGDTSVQAPSPEVIRNAKPISRLSFLGFGGLVRMGATTGQLFYALQAKDTRTCSPLQLEGCICEQPKGQLLEVCYPAEMAQQAIKSP